MITIPYLTKDGKAVGGEYYKDHIFVIGLGDVLSYEDWIKQQGGQFIHGKRELGSKEWTPVIQFENEEDAIVFKLKYV